MLRSPSLSRLSAALSHACLLQNHFTLNTLFPIPWYGHELLTTIRLRNILDSACTSWRFRGLLSLYSGDDFNSGMMRAAALGYIMKGGDFEELSEAIRRAAAADHSY